jgi:hypothetical protein
METDKVQSYYIVFCYCDYRKEVDIQHLKIFIDREQAIEFAKKYSSDNNTMPEYVGPCGTEYDAPFIGSYTDDEDDDEREGVYEKAKKELSINNNMWYIRIAVSKVSS